MARKPYIRSTTKQGYICQTEVTWGQWAANRITAAIEAVKAWPARVMLKRAGHF